MLSLFDENSSGIPDSQERPQDAGVRKWLVSLVMFEVCNSRSVHSKNTLASEVQPSNTSVSGRHNRWYLRVMLWILRIACFDMHERYRRTLIYAHENGGIKVTTFQKLLAGTLQEWTGELVLLPSVP